MMLSLMPQDMLRGDLDADAGVGGYEVLYLIKALAGEIGDGLRAFTAVIIATVEAHHVQRAHRPQGARVADGRERLLRLTHLRQALQAVRSCPWYPS